MNQDAIFTQKLFIEYGDVDRLGELSFPKLFNFFQNIAFNHSDLMAQAIENKKIFTVIIHSLQFHPFPHQGFQDNFLVKLYRTQILSNQTQICHLIKR